MKHLILFAALFAFAATAFGAAADLASARFQYDAAITAIHAGRMDAEKNLATQYTNALATLRTKAQNDGDLDKTKLVLAEAARFEKEHAAPANPPASPDLQNLAALFVKRSHEIEVKEASDILKQAQQFAATLATMQKALTKEGKLDQATAVQEERKTLAASIAGEQTLASAAASTAQQGRSLPAGNRSAAAAPPARPQGAPADAVQFKDRWFRIYEDDIGWIAAKKKCEHLGGHLAVVPDEATWEFLDSMIKDRNVWLGATERGHKGKWIWVDGSDMSFNAWGPQQPNNLEGRQDCLQSWKRRWDDLAEDGLSTAGKRFCRGYVCEWGRK